MKNNLTELIVLVCDVSHQASSEAEGVLAKQVGVYSKYAIDNSNAGKKSVVVWYVNNLQSVEYLADQLAMNHCDDNVVVEFLEWCGDGILEYDGLQEVDSVIRCGCHLNVEQALEMLAPAGLSGLPVWFYGVVPSDGFVELTACTDVPARLTSLLPSSHRKKVWSWVALLTDQTTSGGLQWKVPVLLDLLGVVNIVKLIHAFEDVSGSGCDTFDAEHILRAIGLTGIDVLATRSEAYGYDEVGEDEDNWWDRYGCDVEDILAGISCKSSESIKRQFPTPESLMYTLWYSCFDDFSLSNEEKQNMLFSADGYDSVDFAARSLAYEVVRDAYR